MAGPTYRDVVRLPETAWHDGHVLMVDEGQLVQREAALVRRLGTDVLVRGAFAADEPVLVTPIPGAHEGMRVSIVGEGSNGG